MDTTIKKQIVNFLWIEGELTKVSFASLSSFQKLGYKCVLYHYGKVTNIPKGIIVKDGSTVLDLIQGNPALFSDYFRYKLLLRDGGIWSDCDNILQKRLPKAKYIFSGNKNVVHSHIIKTPKGAPILKDIINIIEGLEDKIGRGLFIGDNLGRKVVEHKLEEYLIHADYLNPLETIDRNYYLGSKIIDWKTEFKDAYNIHLHYSNHRVVLRENENYKINIKKLLEDYE